MKFLTRVVPVLLAASSMVRAASIAVRTNDDFFSEFIDALNKNNLTTLAESYKRVAKTNEGKEVIDALKNNGKVTVLAPDNKSFKPDHPSLSPDVLLYNTVWGSIDDDFEGNSRKLSRRKSTQTRDVVNTAQQRPPPNRRQKRTDPQKYQVQVIDRFSSDESWKRWTNTPLILIDRAVGSAKVVNRFNFKNIIVLIIDKVLSLPAKISDLLCKPLIKSAPNGLVKFGSP
ncbi:hypothetical protein BN14_06710 [Rhizoctonia solani AG-1 IB]|uniref:FAS1 domain-containing protein n=1 Tax=Thanatephorus cucumeris (strain AG1-IB / isolate 7/3/14) TaxID=1108050 RepID=M5CA03_THACB|nr:hypothetical protein BN14_06710 [Rhizoctonia solani AG-1 IB]